MKRSKIFLGISTGVLAVVAFTAAKTAKFSSLRNAYYAQSGSTNCTVKATNLYYSIPVSGAVQATSGSSSTPRHAPLYTFNAGGTCQVALYTKGTE